MLTLTALPDWLSFTLPDMGIDRVVSLPGFGGLEGWSQSGAGDLGYRSAIYKGHITILYSGNPGMGIHVRISGQGCRELEGAEGFPGWREFLTVLTEPDEQGNQYAARFTRFDLAMDDEKGLLSMSEIERCISETRVASTYRKCRGMCQYDLRTGNEQGKTIYFGSRSSDSMIRFYDKGFQMGMPESFVRCELELHGKQADGLVALIKQGEPLGWILAGLLRRKVDFKAAPRPDSAGGQAYEDWETVAWWNDFLAGVKKLRLGLAPIVRSIQKARSWLVRQCSPLFALAVEVGDGPQFIADMLSEGMRRRRPWHEKMLEQCRSSASCPA